VERDYKLHTLARFLSAWLLTKLEWKTRGMLFSFLWHNAKQTQKTSLTPNVELSGRPNRRNNAKQRRFGLSSEARSAERA
jgi:hypothetical protein